jgi:predicted RNA binding protein YcfA (HicA-like mRNA interferase family)
MTQRDKLFNKFLQNPESVSYKEMQKILGWYEFEKIVAKGSHIKFKHPHFPTDLIVAVHNNDCKGYMKKEAAKRIKKLTVN